jgi:hypothetical protein
MNPHIYSLAAEYAQANPNMTPAELRQLFPMGYAESQSIMKKARRIAQRKTRPSYAKPSGTSQRNKQLAEVRKKRLEEAIAYAIANPTEYATEIADRFRVPSPPITEALAKERARLAELKPPRRKVNRLMAWVGGVMVDPKYCRAPEFERCEGVKI